MRVVKSVRQKHEASADLLQLLNEFRRMVNVCIAVGIHPRAPNEDCGVHTVEPY